MNPVTDKKSVTDIENKSGSAPAPTAATVDLTENASLRNATFEKSTQNFREAIKLIDSQRNELVKNAMNNIKPGRTFDSGVVRQINKLETQRNRLIAKHFAWLLKHCAPEVHAIVHQIIEL